MSEFSVPPLVTPPTTGNLTDLIVDNAAAEPQRVVFRRKVAGGWQDVTARQFLVEVTDVAKGLIATGVEPGQRVGLMSRTRYEWTLCDFAIWMAGAVTVPIYETSSAEQVQWMLSDSAAVACFLESPEHVRTYEQVRSSLTSVQTTWVFESGGLEALVAAGSGVSDAQVAIRRATLTPESLATIIYTSGTTGRPKGCELTHGNFLFELANATELLSPLFKDERSSTLLFLPLAHVFARIIQIGCVMARTGMGHTGDVGNLLEDLAEFQPTFLLAVPRVFERVYNSAEQKAEAAGKGKIFRAAADTSVAYSEALDRGSIGIGLRLKRALFDALVYSKLRTALGGRLQFAVSGGAPLGTRLGHFFRGAGITIIEGYGLTETTAAATANSPEHLKVGTVGRPLPGTSIAVAADGEVLIKGPHVFPGYFNNPAATAEAMTEDGWFRSGDIGALDADGYLTITGRKKELLVTAGGKNVAPAVLEDRLRAHRLISQCMVVGDAQPYIAALVTLDPESVHAWLAGKGRPARPAAELVDDPDVRTEVQAAIDEANKAVSGAEAIKRFRILPVDFTEEGGTLTPSLKLKRNIVLKDFAAEVDALYS